MSLIRDKESCMSITQEIEHVMSDLQKSVDANGNVNLAVLLTEVVDLFHHLKSALPKTNPQERSEIIGKMTELHTFLNKETKRLANQTGLSEEQMLRFAENPNNFTKDQWTLLEKVKTVMGAEAEEIKKVMKQFTPASLEEVKEIGKKKGVKKRKDRDIKRA